ncbi:MAG: hypothetical protein JWL95_566 [Gemmatimonadetes bacterium]|nr:hypothetical protein [Gemmatimonadota bacterium]
MRRRVALVVLAALVLPVGAFGQNAPSPAAAASARPRPAPLPKDSLERARRYATWLLTSRTDSMFANLDSATRAQFGSSSVLDDAAAEVAIRFGYELRVVEERWVTRLGKRQYWRTSKYSSFDEPVILRLVILSTGQLAGLGINPLSQAPPVDP